MHSEYYLQSLGAVLDSFRLFVVNKKKFDTKDLYIGKKKSNF